MNFSPVISVVMPVYNYENFIKESIDSVLAQTMPDFELIIVDDASTDNSSEIARSYLDKRIKIINFPKQRGCYPARNAGMRTAKGQYICVMDADDVCLPDRLENQYQFMEKNPELGLIGGAFKTFSSYHFIFRESNFEKIKLMLLKYCYLHHPTCMICASLIKKYNLYYNEVFTYGSDFDWQVRASTFFPVSNVNTPVLLYRRHPKQISMSKRNEQIFFNNKTRIDQLSFFGITPNEFEKELHIHFIDGIYSERFDEKTIDQWVERLSEANQRTQYYSQQNLKNFLQAHQYRYIHQIKQA